MKTTQNLVQGGDAGHWDQAIYAFLAEKGCHSGFMRTARVYSGKLYRNTSYGVAPPSR